MAEQEPPCCYDFLTVTSSYHIKLTPIGYLHAEKIAEVIFLTAFKIVLPVHLFIKMKASYSTVYSDSEPSAPFPYLGVFYPLPDLSSSYNDHF